MTPTATPLTTRAFLEAVSDAGERELRFVLGGELLVPAGFHVTEVKALSYHAMDCGGHEASWRETHLQLWNPEPAESDAFMRADKFLAIYRRVARSVPVDDDAELRVEYGDQRRPAVAYQVLALEPREHRLLVLLRAPTVTCKARDRRRAAGCQTPSSAGIEPLPTVAGKRCC